MRVDHLVIEADREDHIARHHVTIDEVEEVAYGGDAVVLRARQGYYQLIGQTSVGRYLTVFLGPRDQPGIYGLVTARDASDRERRQYRERRRG